MPADPFSWTLHLEATASLALLVAAYAWAVRRYPVERGRVAAFAGGILLLLAAAVTPLDALTYHLLTAHLLQNVVLAEWAPLLLVLGVPPALAAELARVRPFRIATHPAVALPAWIANYALWHLPFAYDAALRNPGTLLHLEHATYLATGLLFWWPVVHDRPWRLADQARAAYLVVAFVLASPIGLLLALLPNAVYDFYAGGFEPWGLTALDDQRLAGITMAGEQSIVFFAAFAFLFFRFLAAEDPAPSDA